MTKNTKNYRTQKGSRKQSRAAARTPGWVWLFTGLVLGLLIAGFIYIRYFATQNENQTDAKAPTQLADRPVASPTIKAGNIQPNFAQNEKKVIANVHTDITAVSEKPAEKPRFEFYTMLPDIEVPVATTESTLKNVASIPSPKTSTYLQLGSFADEQEADALKASLNLQGFEIHTKNATVNGTKYYRLVMGPYTNDNQAREIQKKLSAAQVSSILLRETI